MKMNKERIYRARWERIQKAFSLQRADRVPVILQYSGFAAHVTQTTMSEFLSSPEKQQESMLRAYRMIGEGDALNYGSFWPYALSFVFMSKVAVPGVELAEGEMWQVVESEIMTRADYDRILDLGWPDFFREFMTERILNDVPSGWMPPHRKFLDVISAWSDVGLPVLMNEIVTTPIELLCGSRSMEKFMFDLVEIPDKVDAVMKAIVQHLSANAIRNTKKLGYPAVWIGGWRSAPFLYSSSMWHRFVWPYFSRIVQEVIDAGLIALLHLDSDWTRELESFRELPRAKCLMALDGETDIHKAREILDGHMCIMGDVPASMLFSGSPDEVYEYSRGLIEKLGPTGFILQSGCDIPANAQLENVQAMVQAALDFS
jgi:uroporphyrinogen-III decarboxylase